jgi:2-dehydrotetronate isomerase
MPKFSANLTMLFTELPFEQRFEAASRAGFKAVECLFPYGIEVSRLSQILQDNSLQQAMFNLAPGNWDAGDRGMASDPSRFDEVKSSVELALKYAEATGAKRLHLMAGLADSTDSRARTSYLRAVVHAADALAAEGLELLLEPINNRSIPGYFLNNFDLAESLIKEVARPNVRLQYDVFHRQIIHGDVTVSVKRLLPLIGHVQIASIPSRHEPDGEELNYAHFFKVIDEAGYDGWLGCEYIPRASTTEGLSWFDPYRGEQ